MVEATPKPKRKKYKYTRELVRIATHDGMTQQEIARLCRVEQSVVSGWLNGKSLAHEQQVVELKRRYGARLNRTTSRIYLVRSGLAVTAAWEESARAKELNALQESIAEERKQSQATNNENDVTKAVQAQRIRIYDNVALIEPPSQQDTSETERQLDAQLDTLRKQVGARYWASIEEIIAIERQEFEAMNPPLRIVCVEGTITLRYTFTRTEQATHGRSNALVRRAIARWLVHHQGRGRFVLVCQEPRRLTGRTLAVWAAEMERRDPEKVCRHDPERYPPPVESADDAGRWVSTLHGPFDDLALLAQCDEYLRDMASPHGPHDRLVAPFLVRKMLVELGYDVPGVERLVAEE